MQFDPTAKTLAEKLGFEADDRILIINADDAGMCHAENRAVIELMKNGLVTSSSIMACCKCFDEISDFAAEDSDTDFGVHLTQTCEWENLRWGGVADPLETAGLYAEDGFFQTTVDDVYRNSTPDEAEIESRAQIEKCLAAGIDISHLDSHMGTMQYDVKYHEVYQRLAKEYSLPVRMASREILDTHGAGFLRDSLHADGIICTDYMIYGGRGETESVVDYWLRMIGELKPGVTELFIHPAVPGDEIRSIMQDWETRTEEYRLFADSGEIAQLLEKLRVKLIGYRPLRALQRIMNET